MADDIELGVADYLANPQQPVAPRLKDSLLYGVQQQPDYQAEMRRVSRATGVPLPAAVGDDAHLKAQAQVQMLDPNGLVRTVPKTANWLSQPDNAAVAHDDVDTLKEIERAIMDIPRVFPKLAKSAGLGFVSNSAGAYQAMSPFLRAIGVDLDPTTKLGQPDDPNSTMGQALTAMRQATKKAADKSMPQTDNAVASGVNAGVVSFFQNLPYIGAAIAAKNPALGLAGAGANTGGQAYGDALDQGLSQGKARVFAGIQGGIEIATEKLPLDALVGDYIKHSGLLTTFLHQMVTEVPGEQIATLTQDFTEWAFLHPDKPFSDYLAARPDAAISTLVATAVGGAGHASLASVASAVHSRVAGNQDQLAKAGEAGAGQELLGNLEKAATASALRSRDPQTFKEYVDAVTQDHPVDRVYINAGDLVDILAQGSPEKLAQNAQVLQSMPSVMPQLDDAVRTGGLVEIPLSELLAFTPETSLGQAMMEHLKIDPEGMSPAEAQVFLQEHEETMKAEVAKAVEAAGTSDEFATSAEAVRQNIEGQLATANRFTPDVNAAYSHLVGAFYATQAARLNVTPEQLFEQHPLAVQAQGVTAGSLTQAEASAKPNDLALKALEITGRTNDPAEAGYILNDGTMLDLSGRHQTGEFERDAKGVNRPLPGQRDYFAGVRQVDHRDVAQELVGESGTDAMLAFMHQAQAVRYMPGIGMDATVRPSDKQIRAAVVGHNKIAKGEPFRAEVASAKTGNTLATQDFEKPTVEAVSDFYAKAAYEAPAELNQDATPAHISYEPGLGFQSTLFSTVLDKGQAKASADQWLAMIQNAPGVKKEELEWIGLPEALKLMGLEGAITREQVLTYIAQNGVRLTERLYAGDTVDASGEEHFAEEDEDGQWVVYGPNAGPEDVFDNEGDAYRREEELNNPPAEVDGPVHYEQYQAIKGGQNYRELLLIMPKKGHPLDPGGVINSRLSRPFSSSMGHWDVDNVLAHTRIADFTTPDGKRVLGVLEIQSDWHQKGRDKGYAVPATQEEQDAAADAWDKARAAGEETARSVVDLMPDLLQARLDELAAVIGDKPVSEYEEAERQAYNNYTAATLRGRDRPGEMAANAIADANEAYKVAKAALHKVGTVQFIVNQLKDDLARINSQSLSVEEKANLASRVIRATEYWQGNGRTPTSMDIEIEVHERVNTYADAKLKTSEAQQRVHQVSGQAGIPDAPFKATWPALAMKRIIRMAVEEGYDHVAWATGEQQADLYDMREHIDQVTAHPYSDMPDNDQIAVYIPGRHAVTEQLADRGVGEWDPSNGALKLTRAQAAEVFGTELGNRIYDRTMADRVMRDDGYYEPKLAETFEGADLTIGGEGHKAFYNRNLVNITNDIIKKLGAKVAPLQIVANGGPSDLEYVHNRIAHFEELAAQPPLTPEQKAELEKGLYDLQVRRNSEGQYDHDLLARLRPLQARDTAELMLKNAREELEAKTPRQWGFPITEQMKTEDKAVQPPLFQGEKQEPRGSFNPQTGTITILRNADLSTFLHETGHFFLETLAHLAGGENAPQEVKDDWDKAANFVGFGGIDPKAWLAIPVDARREGHELFARGFEAYLREGRAPAMGLSGLFHRFKSWLMHVYRDLSQLKVELTPEVRGVMDRLLATDAEIAQAENSRAFAPVFDTKPDSMTDLEWAAYQRLGSEATADAQDQLSARSIRDMRWLSNTKARIMGQLAREAKEKRAAIRAEAQGEVINQPVYAAQQFLRRGLTVTGENVEGPHRLAIDKVAAIYEGTPQELQDWRKLGYGKYGMLAEEGLDPDHVAELFGYTSGHELVEALLAAPPMRETVEGLTGQRMLERYGDLTDQDAIERAADEAIHNDARLRFVATEASALAKATGKVRVLADAARDYAAQLIGRQRVRDVKPAKYTGAETRAARAAATAAAKGDLVLAATEKRNQLINGYAAKAAFKAQGDVEAALRLFDRLQSTAAIKSIDPEYREQIEQLLERFDLRKGQSLKAIDNRKSLRGWIEAMQAKGFEPVIDDKLTNEAYRTHYKDMTVDELRGLVDAVKNIAHLGRLKNRLLVAANGRAFQAVVDEAEASIRDHAYRTLEDKPERNTAGDKLLSGFRSFLAQHRKMASLVREMGGLDENDRGGILWRAFIEPMNRANDKEAAMREKATLALTDIFKPILEEGGLRKKLFIPEIGRSLTLEGRMAVALNWGNELNRARIQDGNRWTPDQVAAILQTLDAKQLGFVNQMHEYLDSFWPEIAAKERRVTGVEPEKVEAEPYQVRSADGQLVDMRGGYYPIKYDAERSSRSEADEIAEAIRGAMRGAYTRATTRRGHTQARVDKVERPVRMDLSVPFQHVNQVIHDLSFHEYLIDANRLLSATAIDAAIRDHYGVEVLRTMRDTLKDIAEGDSVAENALDRVINHIRVGSTIVGLGLNLMTAAQQPLGLTQSIVRVGPKYMAKGIGKAFADAVTLENSLAAISEKSDFMRLRAKTMMREINEVQNKVSAGLTSEALDKLLGKGAYPVNQGLGAVQGSFFSLITKLQLVADIPTWLGAHDKALAQGLDEKSAVDMADQAVRDSQGSGQVGDLAQIQRGSVWFKLWTNFYSFFSIGYNQMAESVAETRRVGPSRLPQLAADVALVAFLPAILGELLKRALRGDDWDWDELGPSLAKAQLSYLFGFMVGLRELGGVIQNDGKSPGGPASLRLLTSDLPNLYKQIEQGQMDDAARKAALNVGGILFHFPAAQINRTIDGMEALGRGDTHNPMALLFGAPKAHKG